MTPFQRIGLWAGPIVFGLFWMMGLGRSEISGGLSADALLVLGLALWMALWWITEATDLAVTSLLPLVILPIFGITSVKDVALAYSDRFVMLLMGGFFVATCIERWHLHRRLALSVISRIGTSPQRMVVGFLLTAALLSMWISNTATTLMMLPIASAVVARLGDALTNDNPADKGAQQRLGTALMLAIAYGASIGGIGTPIGTPPNMIFLGQYHTLFPDAPRIGFLQWMAVAMPIVVLMVTFTAWYLARRVGRFGSASSSDTSAEQLARDLVRRDLHSMGPLRGPELRIVVLFALTAVAWITRGEIVGADGTVLFSDWARVIGVGDKVDDSTVAMGAALIAFILPAGDGTRHTRLLDWATASKIPWGLLLLFGGGIALAKGFESTHLSKWLGASMEPLADVSTVVLVAAVCLVVTFLTEVTSNTATTTILMPILAAVSLSTGLSPLALMLPAALSASFAFMLPVATAPNAIVFATGHVTVPQMAKAGFWINLAGVLIVTTVFLGFVLPLLGGS